ncbi:MAG TPA: RNA-binding S4 domain-containing protein [Acidimicrobiales bacterium]|jgi:ribosome-associated protein|nr:RNA-binding S4 domain-containing protein [Acidimicrobiales bacterium]
MREVAITDDMIRLGQFLKLADLADSGSDARQEIAAGGVRVNGEVELRRGRQLHPGDVVSLGSEAAQVA